MTWMDEAMHDPRRFFDDPLTIVHRRDIDYEARLALLQRWLALGVAEGGTSARRAQIRAQISGAILALEAGARLRMDEPKEAPPHRYGVVDPPDPAMRTEGKPPGSEAPPAPARRPSAAEADAAGRGPYRTLRPPLAPDPEEPDSGERPGETPAERSAPDVPPSDLPRSDLPAPEGSPERSAPEERVPPEPGERPESDEAPGHSDPAVPPSRRPPSRR